MSAWQASRLEDCPSFFTSAAFGFDKNWLPDKISTVQAPHVPFRHLNAMLQFSSSAASSKRTSACTGTVQVTLPCFICTKGEGIVSGFLVPSVGAFVGRTGGFFSVKRVSFPGISEPTVHLLLIVCRIGECADSRRPLNTEYSCLKHTERMIHSFFTEVSCFKIF